MELDNVYLLSLCNPFILKFLIDQSDTLNTFCRHTEDVYKKFKKINRNLNGLTNLRAFGSRKLVNLIG